MERTPLCYVDPHRREDYVSRIIVEWPHHDHLHEVLKQRLPTVVLSRTTLQSALRLILEGASADEAVGLYRSILVELAAEERSRKKSLFGHAFCLRTRPAAQAGRCRLDLRLRGDADGTALSLMNKSGVLVAVLSFGRKGIHDRAKDSVIESFGLHSKDQRILNQEQTFDLYRWPDD